MTTALAPYLLVLYYSRYGAVKALAEEIALGIESNGIEARLRTVPPVTTAIETNQQPPPSTDDLLVSLDEMRHCAGLALGSPTRFGNMAAPLKHFLDSTSELWLSGSLINKPATVFSSTATLHGGQETTLLSMMLPLLHHGMLLLGSPFTETNLITTHSGGTPYGVTHVTFGDHQTPLSTEEKQLAKNIGRRLAEVALRLK